MKNINNKGLFVGILLALAFSVGCEDEFLERPPMNSVADVNFYKTDEQVLAASGMLYNRVWFDYNAGASFSLGDFRAGTAYSAWGHRDNVRFNTTGNTAENGAAWKAFYTVVGQANQLLKNMAAQKGPDVSELIENQALGEARFMRGLAYYYLVMNWQEVPIIEDNSQYLKGEPVRKNTTESVWKFITKDLRRAAEYLPPVAVAPGRVTQWSAEAALARVYLTRAGVGGSPKNQTFLDSAMYYSKRVIEAPGTSLLGNYEDLFKIDYAAGVNYDNNPESLFSLQWIFAPGQWGSQNTVPAPLGYGASVGNGDGWGGDLGATKWMLELYDGMTDKQFTLDKRLKTTFMLPGFVYPEAKMLNKENKVVTLEYPLMGSENGGNYAAIKKYVPGKGPADQVAAQYYGHDTYMIRLAEMYLTYAEASLGNSNTTSDPQAIAYVNELRARAGLGPLRDPLKPESDPPLTEITFRHIFDERIKEFAMEGMAWYDLIRLRYWNKDLAYAIIKEQDRGLFYVKPNVEPGEKEKPTNWELLEVGWYDFRKADANDGNFYLPLPTQELSQMPSLMEPAVDYYAE